MKKTKQNHCKIEGITRGEYNLITHESNEKLIRRRQNKHTKYKQVMVNVHKGDISQVLTVVHTVMCG